MHSLRSCVFGEREDWRDVISLPLGPLNSVVVRRDDVCAAKSRECNTCLVSPVPNLMENRKNKSAQVAWSFVVIRVFVFMSRQRVSRSPGPCWPTYTSERLCMGERANAGVTCERVCIRYRFRSCRVCACRRGVPLEHGRGGRWCIQPRF